MPFSLKNWINVLLILVSVDSYFERFPEKDDKVPPIRNANPEKIKTNPNNTIISASQPGIFFFSIHTKKRVQIINILKKKKIKTNPNNTIISASHPGILFLSSQEIGCAQIILMKKASKNGVIIDFA